MTATRVRPHIIQMEENIDGHDVVVGDIHGEITLFKNLVSKLRPQDRLFMVGDLTDRGEGSLAVLNLIKKHNETRAAPQIFSVLGNHEILLLRYIDTRLRPVEYSPEAISSIAIKYFKSGGEWAKDLDDDTLQEIRDQIAAFPFVIHVKGVNPFIIAHADFPLTDKELEDRFKTDNLRFTQEERTYITWARTHDPKNAFLPIHNARPADSILVYVGHSPLDGVRSATNHINLDLGSFFNRHIGIVNHSTRKGVAHTLTSAFDEDVEDILEDINEHLQSQTRSLTATSQLKDNFKNEINVKAPFSFQDELDQLILKMTETKIFNDELFTNFKYLLVKAAVLILERSKKNETFDSKNSLIRLIEVVDDYLKILQRIKEIANVVNASQNDSRFSVEQRQEFAKRAVDLYYSFSYAVMPMYDNKSFDSNDSLYHLANMRDLLDAMMTYLNNPFDSKKLADLGGAKLYLDYPEIPSQVILDLKENLKGLISFGKIISSNQSKMEEEKEESPSFQEIILTNPAGKNFKIFQKPRPSLDEGTIVRPAKKNRHK